MSPRKALHAMLGFALLLALPALGRAQTCPEEVPTRVISIYHVAPGQHVAFLEWMAERAGIDNQVGVPQTEWYAHMDGASWDYIGIGPDLSEEQENTVEEATRAAGLTVGAPAGIELRRYMASHTDTFAAGPLAAGELLACARGPE